MMESSQTTIAPLLIRNILTTILMFADKPLLFIAEKHKLVEFIRWFVVSTSLFFLGLLPSLFPSAQNFKSFSDHRKGGGYYNGADSGVARALSQLLSLVNDIPLNSRKYQVVRSLAEKLIDENLDKGNDSLREINHGVLSAAFRRTLSLLEAAILDCGRCNVDLNEESGSVYYNRLRWFLRGVVGQVSYMGSSAEKLAAESLWLARKMFDCGCVEEAVRVWASATRLPCLALSVDQRLQSSLVKFSAFLFKQAQDIGTKDVEIIANGELNRMKMRMLTSWLPLLCRGSNGIDVPVLSLGERAELEKTLEDIIETLRLEEREKVLSVWLYHFTQCASSDWPNLQDCYTRWYNSSCELLLSEL
ncbi:hypothetical protein Leryth_025010 [Lithospermum erythrorhizon]|nr:hypothetical protein Leryth_025010 [Lithospermum erythrorhizon]